MFLFYLLIKCIMFVKHWSSKNLLVSYFVGSCLSFLSILVSFGVKARMIDSSGNPITELHPQFGIVSVHLLYTYLFIVWKFIATPFVVPYNCTFQFLYAQVHLKNLFSVCVLSIVHPYLDVVVQKYVLWFVSRPEGPLYLNQEDLFHG